MYAKILSIIMAIGLQIAGIFTTVWGWVLFVFATLVSLISAEKFSFIVLGVVIFIDYFWGLVSAKKQGKPITSFGFRQSILKTGIYLSVLLPVMFIERALHEEWLIVFRSVCALAAACELWSASASMLIVYPDFPFLKLFRLQLTGEINKKLKVDIEKAFNEGRDDS